MPNKKRRNPWERGAGILLAVSSLPSNYGIGSFGEEAYRFIDFLKEAGQKYWQVLPVGPTSFGDSPYQSFSAFAGNPYFIDLDLLIEEGLISKKELENCDWGSQEDAVDYAKIFEQRYKILHIAFSRSNYKKNPEYLRFQAENDYWLDDYCLFMSLKFYFEQKSWQDWPKKIRLMEPQAVTRYREELKNEIGFWRFCQYQFFRQWQQLKAYANQNEIQIIGDIPIYAALDSADVWTHSPMFLLDRDRRPVEVAGVPPDSFSKNGQLWGNPLYDWDKMEQDGFDWWKKRMAYSARIYDVIRIDHFIGIVRYFAIPAGDCNAHRGEWRKGPGIKLTGAIDSVLGETKVIAEDLGVLVPQVRKLLKRTGYPGMKVLQFAFNNGFENEHLPSWYTNNLVVYGGTHDNETLAGHFLKRNKETNYALEYLGVKRRKDIPDALLRAAYASVANTVIFQAQDFLNLPNSARMNFPSTIGTNWKWRLKKGQLTKELAKKINRITAIYGR